ncbi:MAG: hypothetical protein M3Y07_00865 [Acidobacteriota bacterium]|nr:hypothetical protein [Acidobacteriota bacterium]
MIARDGSLADLTLVTPHGGLLVYLEYPSGTALRVIAGGKQVFSGTNDRK